MIQVLLDHMTLRVLVNNFDIVILFVWCIIMIIHITLFGIRGEGGRREKRKGRTTLGRER